MNSGFKYLCLLGAAACTLINLSYAQETGFQLNEVVTEDDVYVPRSPTEEELRHYKLMEEARDKWSALFDDHGNAERHLDVAKHYNLLGSGDIALHELGRAEELGIPRSDLLAEIGRAYFLRQRYDDILNEVTLASVPFRDHGEVYLLRAHAYYQASNLKEAFINYYQADQFLQEDRLELNAPLAELFDRMGEYEKAELNVDKALQFAPKDADLLMLKGRLVHRKFGAEQSYHYFERANFYRPDDIKTEIQLAAALYDLGHFDEMVEILRKVLAKDPAHPLANFMIAANFAKGNNVRTAMRYLNQAGRAYDDFAPALFLKGKLAYATESYSQAEEALERLTRWEPDHVDARRLLAAALMQQNKYREAVRALEYLVDHNLIEDTDYPLLGNAYILAGDNDKGTEFLYRATKLDLGQINEIQRRMINDFGSGMSAGVSLDIENIFSKNSSIDQNLIVETYEELSKEKYEDAFEKAARIIGQDRSNPIGYNLLGLTYLGQKKIEEARSNFRRALQIDRNFHQARLNLAKLEMSYGDQNGAITSLNQILSQDESYIPAYELLHDIAVANGDIISAERYLVTASNANPGKISPRIRLMDFYLNENNIAKAKTTALRMAQIFPDHYASYKALGQVYLREENAAAAQENLEKSIQLYNQDAEVYILLSHAYALNDMIEKIRPMLREGLLYVKDKLPLQVELIELARKDGNFPNSHLFADQLKLDERTKANAFIYQGELFLLQTKGEDAKSAFQRALKAGAPEDSVDEGLAQAEELIQNAEQAPENAAE